MNALLHNPETYIKMYDYDTTNNNVQYDLPWANTDIFEQL